MEKTLENAIKLLRSLRSIHSNSNGGAFSTNAVYITPAQQLRNSADRMEYEDKLLQQIDEFIK